MNPNYITKEQFINLLNNLDFGYIERAEIDFITNLIIDNENMTQETRGFNIQIC